jgi:hypothetical protein
MSVPIESIEARLARQELPVKYEYCRLQNDRIAYVEHLRRTAAAKNVNGGGAGTPNNIRQPEEMTEKKSRNAMKRVRTSASKHPFTT